MNKTKLSKNIEEGIEQILPLMKKENVDMMEIPNSMGMVLVLADSKLGHLIESEHEREETFIFFSFELNNDKYLICPKKVNNLNS